MPVTSACTGPPAGKRRASSAWISRRSGMRRSAGSVSRTRATTRTTEYGPTSRPSTVVGARTT